MKSSLKQSKTKVSDYLKETQLLSDKKSLYALKTKMLKDNFTFYYYPYEINYTKLVEIKYALFQLSFVHRQILKNIVLIVVII